MPDKIWNEESKQQPNPDWITAPYVMQGIADPKLMAQIEAQYPPPKYKVTKNGPDSIYGFYFYSVEEQTE